MGRVDGRLELDRVVFAYGAEPVIKGISIDVPAGRLHRARRRVGRRQVDDREADRALLRPARGRRPRRRARPARRAAALVPPPARRRAAGSVPLQRHDRRQHPLRPPGRDRRGGARRRREAIGVDRVAARFADGLDHVVREGGAGLSAGERQLISIARALLADPRILILDEATSNIDRPSEILIERAFDRLLDGRTSIIIAHRLATVRRADEILVLERGRVVAARHRGASCSPRTARSAGSRTRWTGRSRKGSQEAPSRRQMTHRSVWARTCAAAPSHTSA